MANTIYPIIILYHDLTMQSITTLRQYHLYRKNYPASSQYRSPQTNYQDWRQIHWSRYNQVSYHRSAEKVQQEQVQVQGREQVPVPVQAHKWAWKRKKRTVQCNSAWLLHLRNW